MNSKNKTSLILVIMLFIMRGISYGITDDSFDYEKYQQRVLIVCSYNNDSKWERSVVDGIIDGNRNIKFKVEFLDSDSSKAENYYTSFLDLLELKYSKNIDAVVTVDDEAFNLIRSRILDSRSFLYRKPCLFLGVNDDVVLSPEEKKCISGIVEYQNNLMAINTMLGENKKAEDIYILVEENTYGNTIIDNFEGLKEFALRDYNIIRIHEDYIEDLIPQLNGIDRKKGVLYLCGSYVSKETGIYVDEADVVRQIKKVTDAQLYTKLEPYVYGGAIGGIINNGFSLGRLAQSPIENLVNGKNVGMIVPTYGAVNIPMFNFHAVREYGINPMILPENSVYINKGPFNLLVPQYLEFIIWGLIVAAAVSVIMLIYRLIITKRNEAKHKKLLQESIERENIRTDYIITISHELRTPLNIILNATKLIKFKIEEGSSDRKYFIDKLEYIENSSRRLLRSINNLIDVSKIEMGYMKPQLKNINLVETVEDATMYMVDFAKSYNITILFDTDEEEITGAFDKMQIERVVLNLLSNSIKYTGDGGRISVSVARSGENAVIEVADDGKGIKAADIPFIFEKFKRIDSEYTLTRQYEGSGLGLFIVKSFVQLHNGEVSVVSGVEKGTVFTIRLPIRSTETDAEDDKGIVSLKYLSDLEEADITQNKI